MKTKSLIIFTTFFLTVGFLSYEANAQYTKLLDFAGATNGSNPWGSLISDGTFLYGMTDAGGTNNGGTIFKIMTDGTGYVKLMDFTGTANGSNPRSSLISDGTFLYGMTYWGGTNNMGTIFKIMPDGTGYVKLMDFAGNANGSYPYGSLVSDGTFLYGMTYDGGINGMGVLFKIMPDGTGYVKLMDFAGVSNGSAPQGSLIFDGTFLYGMTYAGGTNYMGVIFKIMPDGTGYVKLMDFAGTANGSYPSGSLISDGTFLYGMTSAGGTNNKGVLFKIMPIGTGYVKLMDFGGVANGNSPQGSLISDGTFLYGMTFEGGANNAGTIFKVLPDGTGYVKLMDFTGVANGSNTRGSLISDGTFLYGMTNSGGTNSVGTIFKHGSYVGIAENNLETDFTIYPNPFSSMTNLQTDKYLINATLTVYNLFGQQVKQIKNISGQTVTLFRDNLSSGLYFIRLTQDNNTFTTKLIVTD